MSAILEMLPKVKGAQLHYVDPEVYTFVTMLHQAVNPSEAELEAAEEGDDGTYDYEAAIYKVIDEMLIQMVKTKGAYRETLAKYIQAYGPLVP